MWKFRLKPMKKGCLMLFELQDEKRIFLLQPWVLQKPLFSDTYVLYIHLVVASQMAHVLSTSRQQQKRKCQHRKPSYAS
jgi:hypothetical protein